MDYRVVCQSDQNLFHHSQHVKNQLNSYTHSYDTADFMASWTKQPYPFLMTINHWNNFFISWICNSMKKTQFIPSVHSCDIVSFRVPWPDQPHPLLTILTKNIFDQLWFMWNCINIHAKNQAISLNCSRDIVD